MKPQTASRIATIAPGKRFWASLFKAFVLTASLLVLFPSLTPATTLSWLPNENKGLLGSALKVKVGWYVEAGMQDGTRVEDLGGYNFEYLSKIAQYEGWNYEYHFGTWNEMEDALANGEIDLLGDVGYTQERAQKYNYASYANISSPLLMICRNSDELYFNDYPAFNGLKVAGLNSDFRQNLLKADEQKNSYTVDYVTFSSDAEIFDAFDNAKNPDGSYVYQAALIANTSKYQNYKIISEWEPTPFYFVANKNKPEVLSGLNDALLKIQSSDSTMEMRLFEKYFNNNGEGSMIALTKEEAAFLKSNHEVTLVYCPNEKPLIFKKDDRPAGIIPDYLSLLEDKMGITVTYEECKTHEAMISALAGESNRICAQFPYDFQYSQSKGAMLSKPFLALNYGLVAKPSNIDHLKKIGYEIGDDFLGAKITALGYESFPFDTAELGLSAVLSNEIDAVAIDSMIFEQISYHAKYRSLSFYSHSELDFSLSLALSDHSDYRLLGAFDKATGAVSEAAVAAIKAKNTTLIPEYTVGDYMETNGMTLVALVILVLLIIALIYFFVRAHKNSKKLELARREADEASQAKSTFLSTMSHDLRTPLNGIVGFTDLALESQDPLKREEYLHNIKSASILLTDMVNDTLELSRIESGKMVNNPEPVSTEELVDHLVSAVKPLADEKHITLVADRSAYPHENILVDRLKIQKIILNLLSNAVKYTGEGGTVIFRIEKIESAQNPMTRRIIVKDNGIGMSEEFLTRLYQPFAQENRPESHNVSGTGLGLTIVKRIVELMGGTIRCESKLGAGTRFVVELPLKTVEGDLNEKPLALDSSKNLKGKRILLVEDNPINAQIATILLKEKGVIVLGANDGAKGVEEFSRSTPGYFDAILMDLRMPNMNGYEACKAIRKMNHAGAKDIPIIAMTADAFDEQLKEAYDSGMNAAITKPIDPSKLYGELAHQIALSQEDENNS
jgi:signal transduction histidine kinase/BarA-like signal transduction histidine kinase